MIPLPRICSGAYSYKNEGFALKSICSGTSQYLMVGELVIYKKGRLIIVYGNYNVNVMLPCWSRVSA